MQIKYDDSKKAGKWTLFQLLKKIKNNINQSSNFEKSNYIWNRIIMPQKENKGIIPLYRDYLWRKTIVTFHFNLLSMDKEDKRNLDYGGGEVYTNKCCPWLVHTRRPPWDSVN